MDIWFVIMELVMLLGGAFLMGAIAQRLGQSPILGYLLAGTIVGPLLFNRRGVNQVSELGVALLLFSIGLEFSFKQLMKMGRMAFGGGTLQVVLTMLAVTLVTVSMVGLPGPHTGSHRGVEFHHRGAAAAGGPSGNRFGQRQGLPGHSFAPGHGYRASGADGQLFYTGCGRDEYGSAHPQGEPVRHRVGRGFYLLLYHLAPILLSEAKLFANRELTVLLSIAVGFGAAWAAHKLHISPALGAFVAGMLLGESPFATQIRADIGSMRIIMVTLFFASVGMQAKPMWFVTHLHWIALVSLSF